MIQNLYVRRKGAESANEGMFSVGALIAFAVALIILVAILWPVFGSTITFFKKLNELLSCAYNVGTLDLGGIWQHCIKPIFGG